MLDEPSIGLHQRDNEMLLRTLRHLTDLGNTLIVVEHDEETMQKADYLVDVGPGAGIHGGEIVAQGKLKDIVKCKNSITGQYLSGQKKIEVPNVRKKGTGQSITIRGAAENNLQKLDVSFPLGVFTCVTGVSGSGKSTLVNEILYKAASRELYRSYARPGKHERIEGPVSYTHLYGNTVSVYQSSRTGQCCGIIRSGLSGCEKTRSREAVKRQPA